MNSGMSERYSIVIELGLVEQWFRTSISVWKSVSGDYMPDYVSGSKLTTKLRFSGMA